MWISEYMQNIYSNNSFVSYLFLLFDLKKYFCDIGVLTFLWLILTFFVAYDQG